MTSIATKMAGFKVMPLFDKRLIGTWKSDRRKIFRNWKPNPGADPKTTKLYQSMFGKMTVKFTRRYVTSETDFDFFPGLTPSKDRVAYEIVCSDSKSVVIRIEIPEGDVMRDILGDAVVHQLYFDGDKGYYVNVSEDLNEYFRRVK